jgi:hypothetical protein
MRAEENFIEYKELQVTLLEMEAAIDKGDQATLRRPSIWCTSTQTHYTTIVGKPTFSKDTLWRISIKVNNFLQKKYKK